MIQRIILMLTAFGATAAAQWLNYPAPGIPRLQDGKPNLSAPAPKGPDGKPDLYGLWEFDRELDTTRRFDPVLETAAPGITIKPEDIVLTSEGKALQRQRRENYFPGAQCLPDPLPRRYGALPFKILTLSGLVVILYEDKTTYRQIFMDGRRFPKILIPLGRDTPSGNGTATRWKSIQPASTAMNGFYLAAARTATRSISSSASGGGISGIWRSNSG